MQASKVVQLARFKVMKLLTICRSAVPKYIDYEIVKLAYI